MSEVQAHVINIHGIAPASFSNIDNRGHMYPDFMPLNDLGLKLVSTGTPAKGKLVEQDADFAQWLDRQTSPVWADISARGNHGSTLPNIQASYERTIEPRWPHQGFYTQRVTIHRRFVQLSGEANFPKYDSTYRTPIFVARLALNGGKNPHYYQIGANIAQLVQPLRKSK